MPSPGSRLKTLVALLDSLYDNYKSDLPYWLRLPIRFILKFADKTQPVDRKTLQTLTAADIQAAFESSKLGKDAALTAAVSTGLPELVASLHAYLRDGLDGLRKDVEEALFYGYLTLTELREFRQEFRDRLAVHEDIVNKPPRNLPPRNTMFVGRTSELDDLHRRLRRQVDVGVTQQVGTHGHGGVGKSALGLEYAWQHVRDYPGGLFWLKCDTDILLPQIAQLAANLHLPTPEREPPEETARRVREHLEAGEPALLILDNVRGPEQWRNADWGAFLPGGNCRRLVTTRSPHLGDLDMMLLERLPRPQGIELLARYRADAGDAGRAALVGDIVDWFDGLAVGLTVVGAYMKLHAGITWEAFADSLERKGLGAVRAAEADVERQGGLPDRYEQRVDAVFDDAFDTLPADQQRALEYAALLPEDNVLRLWLAWLLENDETVTLPDLPGAEADRAAPTIDGLLGLKLLYPIGEGADVLAIHRVLRRRLNERIAGGDERRSALLDRVVALAEVRGEASHAAITDKSLRAELTPLLALSQALDAHGRVETAVRLANLIHTPLEDLARHTEDFVSLNRFVTDEGLPNTAISEEEAVSLLSNLALTLQDLGRLDDARRQMERAIAIREKHFEPDHPTLAISYSNLAVILQDLGRLDDARRQMERAITIWEKHLEADHPTLAISYSNLALILKDLGQLDDARRQMERAIAIEEKHFEPDHPTLATSYSNLATIFHALGRLDDARRQMERAIAINEKRFEADHPTLATTYNNMAYIEFEGGNKTAACELWRRAYMIFTKQFDREHPSVRVVADALRRVCGGVPGEDCHPAT